MMMIALTEMLLEGLSRCRCLLFLESDQISAVLQRHPTVADVSRCCLLKVHVLIYLLVMGLGGFSADWVHGWTDSLGIGFPGSVIFLVLLGSTHHDRHHHHWLLVHTYTHTQACMG
jgi:hypothetical protein